MLLGEEVLHAGPEIVAEPVPGRIRPLEVFLREKPPFFYLSATAARVWITTHSERRVAYRQIQLIRTTELTNSKIR